MPPGEQFNDDYPCPLCKTRHALRKCRRFLSMPLKQKLQLIYDEDICKNCLGLSHRSARRCPSRDNCRKCHRDHNTILHTETGSRQVILEMTAMVYVAECEADEGCMWRIKLNPSQSNSTIAAWAIYRFASLARTNICPEYIDVYMWNRFPEGRNWTIRVTLRVVDEAMECTPLREIKQNDILKRLNRHRTADLFFWRPDQAPITLGADAAKKVYVGAPHVSAMLPMSQCTIFGWVFFGDVKEKEEKYCRR